MVAAESLDLSVRAMVSEVFFFALPVVVLGVVGIWIVAAVDFGVVTGVGRIRAVWSCRS